MNSILLAVDDGLTNANYNWADVFFLIGTIVAVFSAIAYFTGVSATTTTTTNPPRYHYHAWAPALVAFAVACATFGFFLL